MKPEGSLPHSQEPVTCLYPEPDKSSPLKIYFNIMFPSTRRYFKCFLSLRIPHKNPVRTSSLPHTCYMLRPSHSSWLDHLNNIW